MATLDVINSTILALFTSNDGTTWAKLSLSNDASMSLSHSPREITSKDSGGWKELLEGLRSGSISASGYYAHDAPNGADALQSTFVNRTKIYVRFTTNITGDKFYQGQAYITSLERTSPSQENSATFSVEFEFSGPITEGTIA